MSAEQMADEWVVLLVGCLAAWKAVLKVELRAVDLVVTKDVE